MMSPEKKKWLLAFVVLDTLVVVALVFAVMSWQANKDAARQSQSSAAQEQPTTEEWGKRLAKEDERVQAAAKDWFGTADLAHFTVLGGNNQPGTRSLLLYSKRNNHLTLSVSEQPGHLWAKILKTQKPESLFKLIGGNVKLHSTRSIPIQGKTYPVTFYSKPDSQQADGFVVVLQYPDNRLVLLQGMRNPDAPADGLDTLQTDATDLINTTALKTDLILN